MIRASSALNPELKTTLNPSPLLKWAGGKRWLVPHLRTLWSAHQSVRLVELFAGGLAVSLDLAPTRALINDINPHLINLYRQLQTGLLATISMENDSALYYQHRDRFNALIRNGNANTPEAAQLFYYLNRTGFNGLCRFNSRGEFNVPYGQYKTIRYADNVTFADYQRPFATWEFQVGSYADVTLKSGDFVYADPPYDVEFVSYSKEGFSWDDQVHLAAWLSQHDGPVLLSNQATDRIMTLYREHGFKLFPFDAPRRISSTGDRTPAKEVLAVRGVKTNKNTFNTVLATLSDNISENNHD